MGRVAWSERKHTPYRLDCPRPALSSTFPCPRRGCAIAASPSPHSPWARRLNLVRPLPPRSTSPSAPPSTAALLPSTLATLLVTALRPTPHRRPMAPHRRHLAAPTPVVRIPRHWQTCGPHVLALPSGGSPVRRDYFFLIKFCRRTLIYQQIDT